MLWIAPIINMLLWVGYLAGAIALVWGLVPAWGGWPSLDRVGKTITVVGGVLCVFCAYWLVTTSVIPL